MSDIAESNYSYVAVETQFPGPVIRPMGPFDESHKFHWQMLKGNVDLTKVLQLSFAFSDVKGNRPKGISTWRFNFIFDANKDFYSKDVVDQLCQTRNLDIHKHSNKGIQPHLFAELLLGSGLVLNEEIRWITYRGANTFETNTEDGHPGRPAEQPWVQFAGLYDFGHLLLMLQGKRELPDEPDSFFSELDLFFPSRCDVAKHLSRLPQLNGSSLRNAHTVLEAFFRLPDAVRRSAFDIAEEFEARGCSCAGCSIELCAACLCGCGARAGGGAAEAGRAARPEAGRPVQGAPSLGV
eukprot:s592_g6.t1